MYNPIIYRYHSVNRPSVEFYGGKDDGTNLFLGFELEFDIRDRIVARRNNKINLIQNAYNTFDSNSYLIFMHDGSLYGGLEMISQPATYSYHLENYDKYTQVINDIKARGFKSDSYQSTGLHIHFNRSYFGDKEDECIERLIRLTEKFWFDLAIFSRRKYNKLIQWVSPYPKSANDVVKDYKTYKKYGYSAYNNSITRRRAINLTNNNTIEFRLFKGTLDEDKLFATLELVRNMVMCAKHYTLEEIENMSFADLLISERIKKYFAKLNTPKKREKALNDMANLGFRGMCY